MWSHEWVYLDHVEHRGIELFNAVCAHDLEGIAAKWTHGTYHADVVTTSWLKIKNCAYSQMDGTNASRDVSRPAHARGSVPTLCAELRAVAAALHVR